MNVKRIITALLSLMLILALIVSFPSQTVNATSTTIIANANAKVENGVWHDTNFVVGSFLSVGYVHTPDNLVQIETRSFLKFNLSLPSSAIVNNAKLYICCDNARGDNWNTEVWSVENDSWLENTITWDTMPSLVDKLDNKIIYNGLQEVWENFDVTAFVQSHQEDNAISFGLKIENTVFPPSAPYFSSDLYRSISYSPFEPYLEIAYTFPPNLPYNLRVENQTSPQRLTTATPTFSFRYTDNNGDNMKAFRIQVGITQGDSSLWDSTTTQEADNGNTVSKTYGGAALSRGVTYWWRAMVQNSDNLWGDWSDSENFRINQPPTCSISSSTSSPNANESVSFMSNAHDNDGDNLIYFWNFGDSATSDLANPSHSYDSAGIYTVTLYVNDGYESSATDNMTISVQSGGGGGGGGGGRFENTPIIGSIVQPYKNVLFRTIMMIGPFSLNLFWLLLIVIVLAWRFEAGGKGKVRGIMWSSILLMGFLFIFGAGLGIL